MNETSINLWNGSPPHSLGTAEKDVPFLVPHVPASVAGPMSAVIICPGGGYRALMMDHEGNNVGDYFRQRGVAAFVLRYRLPSDGYRHPVPMLDGQRAIRLVRSRATLWNIDPARIGVMGFSAGGHLAATLATHFDEGDPHSSDPVDPVSSRPDFAALVYAVISLKKEMGNRGSKEYLLGPNADPALVAELCAEDQVNKLTPPTYLLHAVDDDKVPIENSRAMYAALKQVGVRAALKELSQGSHGFGYGLSPGNSPAGWLDELFDWLRSEGFVK
ncbi:MAG TPA: alpha/beta hydrolase [Candidatus Methylacidiphilales bacterium]